MKPRFQIAVALDGMTCKEAYTLFAKINRESDIAPYIWGPKGHDLFDLVDPAWFRMFTERWNVWVDYKFHDIGRTVANRVRKWTEAGASALSVHASGGIDMMMSARKAAFEANAGTKLIAITVLTSISKDEDPAKDECVHIFGKNAPGKVFDLALDAVSADVWGIVCSPEEVGLLAGNVRFDTLTKIVPGIRLPGSNPDDQKRLSTPRVAVSRGANILVVGSDITQAKDPADAIRRIIESVEG